MILYRINKNLPLNKLMENMSFVLAKAGIYIVPTIQNVNYFSKKNLYTEKYLKTYFVTEIKRIINFIGLEIRIYKNKRFYYVVLFEDEEIDNLLWE